MRNSTLLPGPDAFDAIEELRDRDGGDLVVWGSPQLVHRLIQRELVDELVLMIEPILLGGGKRLFSQDGAARRLRLAGRVGGRPERGDDPGSPCAHDTESGVRLSGS